MREAPTASTTPRIRALVVAALAAIVALTALVAAPGADAKPKKKKKAVPVKVMTRNIFLGADLGPALNAQDAGAFIAANGGILREVDETDFERRAVGLAQEFRQKRPDLIGLQEVAWWREAPQDPAKPLYSQGDADTFYATNTKVDFLDTLLKEMKAVGLNYRPVVVKKEFDFEAPADYDDNPMTGFLGGEIQGRLTMRDVILINKDSRVKAKAKNARSGTYSALYTPVVSGIVEVPVTRGWTAADITVRKGKKKNRVKKKFRFINTHFEAFDDESETPSIRARQATELVNGPGAKKRVIMLGDFNSDTVTEVKPGDAQAFQVILDAGFKSASTREPASCCVPDLFNGPQSAFDHVVDHIVTNMGKKAKLVNSSVTGLQQVNGMYNSDHAGVFSKLKIR